VTGAALGGVGGYVLAREIEKKHKALYHSDFQSWLISQKVAPLMPSLYAMIEKLGDYLASHGVAPSELSRIRLESMQCPITAELISDPVVTPCFHVFERAHLQAALAKRRECPLDRSALTPDELLPDTFYTESFFFEMARTLRTHRGSLPKDSPLASPTLLTSLEKIALIAKKVGDAIRTDEVRRIARDVGEGKLPPAAIALGVRILQRPKYMNVQTEETP
jgi:hypothetical protein